ncbi:MAG: ABC transporter permease [Candidatus Woesearchaeota archaeon]|jgi:NitT/TauT family transport system permease protein|nr:ABC transporter permease [Candidatus Woesearchaeota archaeon]MDP7181904.1 ABC transporter permease [Candidatus Woesearchaeota archaeon]MDP7199219.1 ABC transporter permease [Candidatus Woesearchaeota archaeon]MDP7467832.1 ABC transporter permease [Candidatus Woesearchaeota archaeon]MDP7647822.1 ABC transporter permease [Candidatus Woesearchaeota archaeon]
MRKHLPPAILILLMVGVWELFVRILGVPVYLFPPPSLVAQALWENAARLAGHFGTTMLESVLGFGLGSGLGLVLATLFFHVRAVKESTYPIAIGIQSTPTIAVAPLLILWFGNGIMTKVVAAALLSFFPVLVNCMKGFNAVPPEAVDLFKSLGSGKTQLFLKLRFPHALPYLFSGLKVGASLAVVGAIVGEFTGGDKGLGGIIVTSGFLLETPTMFAAILLASLGGISLLGVVALLEKRVLHWHHARD